MYRAIALTSALVSTAIAFMFSLILSFAPLTPSIEGPDVYSLSSPGFLIAFGMTSKGASGSKFSQFVPDHLFGYIDRDVLAAVVNGNGVTDHERDNRRSPRPGFDDFFLAFGVQFLNFRQQAVGNKGSFF